MKFSMLRIYNDRLKATTGVHDKEGIVRELLAACADTAERVIAAQLIVGRLSLPSEGLVTGIKESFLARDLGLEGRHSLEDIAKLALERAETGEANPTLQNVWDHLRAYLESSERTNAAKSVFVSSLLFGFARTKEDVPFLLQLVCEKLSNGIDERTVLNALFCQHEGTSYRETVARAYSFNPNIAEWVWLSDNKEHPDGEALRSGRAVPGVPIEPQLCARVGDLESVLREHDGSTLVQPKLDGQRVHIHVWATETGPQVRVFSRALKEVTEDYPEVVQAFLALPDTKKAIFDGELVALGPDGEVAPFEVLQKRLGRKNDRDSIRIGVVLYDVLLWDDLPIGTTAYWLRLKLLEDEFVGSPVVRTIESQLCWRADDLQEILMAAADAGEEGLVCKHPESLPAPGARCKDWIKLKPDYLGGDFQDTYDLVVIGFQKGRGRRHGKIGALWVGIRDDRTGNLWPVCKVGTGLKDADLDWFGNELEGLIQPSPSPSIDGLDKSPEVDVWVEPSLVIEVGATGGMTKIDKWAGMSLRFPYFIRVREDKTVTQATSTVEINLNVAGIQEKNDRRNAISKEVAAGGKA